MNKINLLILLFLVLGIVFTVGLVSAMNIDFFYHPDCPHCQSVFPLISKYDSSIDNLNVNYIDTSQGSYDIEGVPLIRLDNGIELKGSSEIPKYFYCEINEMTTKSCPTLSADTCVGYGKSWFIK